MCIEISSEGSASVMGSRLLVYLCVCIQAPDGLLGKQSRTAGFELECALTQQTAFMTNLDMVTSYGHCQGHVMCNWSEKTFISATG